MDLRADFGQEKDMTYNPNIEDPAFPGFLKNWRQRRRLSQLELSLQSGLSQRHISFLETGRSNPSRFAIAQLAEALEMPAAEVDAMLLSAGFAALSSRKGWDGAVQRAVEASIDHVMKGHEPYPAVSIDRIWNLLKANEAAQRFFTLAGARGETNILREILSPGPVRDCILNWNDTARALLRLLELEVARRPHDQEARQLLDELKSLDGVGDLLSDPSPDASAPVLTIRFRIEDAELELFSLIATIGMSADATLDDMRVETLLPANDATRAWFQDRFMQ